MQVKGVSRTDGSVRIAARATAASASCPGCGAVSSRRVHSRYERRLLDTAVGGCEVLICLEVRRFRCLARQCHKATFAEQVAGLTSRHAPDPAVTAVLEAVALALGGRAGARLSGHLAAAVSRTTLIRLVRAMPDPAVSVSPRVLGVDEFALQKGRRYGTLLVDVETRRPVDMALLQECRQPLGGPRRRERSARRVDDELQVTARLIVRRVRDLNPRAAPRQGELFPSGATTRSSPTRRSSWSRPERPLPANRSPG
ncbi:MAG TPA: transposase family protein [Trebonia sp.]|nr:transposase family protein [Trebonia sp.]